MTATAINSAPDLTTAAESLVGSLNNIRESSLDLTAEYLVGIDTADMSAFRNKATQEEMRAAIKVVVETYEANLLRAAGGVFSSTKG